MFAPALDILTLEIPEDSIIVIAIEDLPINWTAYPAPSVLAEIGENWVRKGATIALKVPSCIFHSASNLILNCRHKEYPKVKILDHRSFHFDSRLNS